LPFLKLQAELNHNKFTLQITDTGSGIWTEQLPRLFRPFHTTKKDKGISLGLYITKQLIERNHDKISAASIEGQAAEFFPEFKKL